MATAASTVTTSFLYRPLGSQKIRIIFLQPGLSTDPLSCVLRSCAFEPKANVIPTYEALSYTWGDQSDPEPIAILDESSLANDAASVASNHLGTVAIGRNLAAALRHLRDESDVRVLWADSICIDQRNLIERAAQVLLMGDLYSYADRVIVWLGPADSNSHLAMAALRRTAKQLDMEDIELDARTNVIGLKEDADDIFRGQDRNLPFSQQEWDAIHRLISRSWFQRLWIRQEITLAGSQSLVLVGSDSILWSELLCAAAFFRSRESSVNNASDAAAFAKQLTNLSSFRRLKVVRSLHSMVDYTRQCQCSDNRDRVYALLGMIVGDLAGKIIPDYRLKVKAVYQEMFLNWCRSYKSLDMLEFCHNGAEEPTWVPDLHKLQDGLGHLEFTWAGAYSPPGELRVEEQGGVDRLEVHGLRCDRVAELIGAVPSLCTMYELVRYVRAAIVCFLGPSSQLWDQRELELITKAIVGGRCFEIVEWCNYPRLAMMANILKRWADDSMDGNQMLMPIVDDNPLETRDERRLMHAMYEILPGRSFYKTSSGFFVVGPNGCRSGDSVYALLGCRTVIALHPISQPPKHTSGATDYKVVGPVYHPSFSYGEAICGPLPPGWKAVVEVGTAGPTFKKDGELWRKQDPRMDDMELPYGWYEDEDEDGRPYWYEDGWEVGEFKDPRLSKSNLEDRGVQLESIYLR